MPCAGASGTAGGSGPPRVSQGRGGSLPCLCLAPRPPLARLQLRPAWHRGTAGLPRCPQPPRARGTGAACPLSVWTWAPCSRPTAPAGRSSRSGMWRAPFQGLFVTPGCFKQSFVSRQQLRGQRCGARAGVPAPCLTCDMSCPASAIPAGSRGSFGRLQPCPAVTPAPGQRDGCVDGAVPGAPRVAAPAGGEY